MSKLSHQICFKLFPNPCFQSQFKPVWNSATISTQPQRWSHQVTPSVLRLASTGSCVPMPFMNFLVHQSLSAKPKARAQRHLLRFVWQFLPKVITGNNTYFTQVKHCTYCNQQDSCYFTGISKSKGEKLHTIHASSTKISWLDILKPNLQACCFYGRGIILSFPSMWWVSFPSIQWATNRKNQYPMSDQHG